MSVKKNFIRPFFIITLILILSSPLGCLGIKSENERLKEEITNLNQENEKLKRDLSILKSENANGHIRLAKLNLQIAALHNEIQMLQKGVDSLKGRAKGER